MSKCIRKHEHLSTRGQCVDCGKPAHKIIQELQQENEALKERVAAAEKYLSDCIADGNPTAWDIAVMEFLQDAP